MRRPAGLLVGGGLVVALAAAGGMSPARATDWTTYAFDNQRTGHNPAETALGTKNVGGLRLGWSTHVGGRITTQPLVATGVAAGAGKKDLVYVGTQDGDAVALDRTTGKVVWRTTLGAVTLACGEVFGVTGTPVLDRARHALYAAAGDGRLHALDEATGAELAGWPVTYVTTPTVDVDWAGLTLAGGKLYVETAGACGDKGPYRGRAVEVDVASHAVTKTWIVNGAKGPFGGGIWGYGGISAEPAGVALYAATGNALGASQNAGLSEHVVRLTPSLGVVASDGPSLVGPDVDFGATPTLYPAAGVASGCLAVMNKSGALFVYARGAVGGGYEQRLQMGDNRLADNGDFIGNPAFDPTLRLLYVNVPFPASPYVPGIVALRVAPDCTLSKAWQRTTAPNALGGPNYPSITPTVANGVVYVVRSKNSLAYAFDAAKGTRLWTSGTRVRGRIYTAATVANGQLLVASTGGSVYAFAP